MIDLNAKKEAVRIQLANLEEWDKQQQTRAQQLKEPIGGEFKVIEQPKLISSEGWEIE